MQQKLHKNESLLFFRNNKVNIYFPGLKFIKLFKPTNPTKQKLQMIINTGLI